MKGIELPVGSTFIFDDKTYQCEIGMDCQQCAFYSCKEVCDLVACSMSRIDGKEVYFKQIEK